MYLKDAIEAYRQSYEFECLAPVTKEQYLYYLRIIIEKWGLTPFSDFAYRSIINQIRLWIKKIANRYPRKAEYVLDVFKILINWAYIEDYININLTDLLKVKFPPKKLNDTSWSDEQIDFVFKNAPLEFSNYVLLALETGLRPCSLRNLKNTMIETDLKGNKFIILPMPKKKHNQRSDGLIIPMSNKLKKWYSNQDFKSHYILTNYSGDPFSKSSLESLWKRFRKKHKHIMEGTTLHGLRKTTVRRLAVSGCTVMEIAALLGWSLKTVNLMLDNHYYTDKSTVALSAIGKLDNLNNSSNSVFML